MPPPEHPAFSVLIGVLAFIAGTLLGGVVNALVKQYAVFKESKGVALALKAELNALLNLVRFRKYIANTDAIIVRLQDPTHVLDKADVFFVRIAQDYFSVFHAVTPKIGLLGPLGSDIVLVYAAAKSLVEDMVYLTEETQAYLEGRRPTPADQDPLRPFLLQQTGQINALLKEAVRIAAKATEDLGAFAEKRWLRIFK